MFFKAHKQTHTSQNAQTTTQSVLFGTSGMRIRKGGLTFNPPPPSATGTAATMLGVHSLHFRGNRISQEVVVLCLFLVCCCQS